MTFIFLIYTQRFKTNSFMVVAMMIMILTRRSLEVIIKRGGCVHKTNLIPPLF